MEKTSSKVDLHMHSSCSDGTEDPLQLVEKVKAAGITTFSLTDHDTVDGVERLADSTLLNGLTMIPGIEFSCKMKEGECHLLGYGYHAHVQAFQSALKEGKKLRQNKLRRRLQFLEREGIHLPRKEIDALWQMSSVGKPHLAKLLVKYGFAENIGQAIIGIINRCPTSQDRIDAETAVHAVLAAGGIPVWAHPLGEMGEKPLNREQFKRQMAELLSYGLKGMECYYSGYPFLVCQELAEIAEKNGLLISGGSDYHGGNKKIALGTLNADEIVVSDEWLSVLM